MSYPYGTAKERAAAGAAKLDELRPDWYRDIQLWRLNIGNCWECILGQLYGHYDDAPLNVYGRPELGFCPLTGEDNLNLIEAWKQQVMRRRLAEVTPPVLVG